MSYLDLYCKDASIFCEAKSEITHIMSESNFPLFVQVLPVDDSVVIESHELPVGTWRIFKGIRDRNFRIVTKNNQVLRELRYDYKNEIYASDASKLYEFWDYFTKLNQCSTGLILGAGDGSWGEWVKGVYENEMKCFLVEGSQKSFEKLKLFHGNKKNLKLLNQVISLDGMDYDFYDDLDGDNSISLEYLNKRSIDLNKSNIRKVKTKKFGDLLNEIGTINWIRFDLEGIDLNLILSLDLENMKSLIMVQYEHLNLSDSDREQIKNKFKSQNFNFLEFNIDTIFIKK